MSAEPRRDSKWWGWGDPAVAPELDAEALAMLRERIGELEPWPLARELEDFELPAAEPLPQALIDAVGAEQRLHRRRGPRPPRDRARLRRPGPAARGAASRRRPTRSCCRPTPTRSRGCSRSARREGVAVVPFGGGTSVVGGVEPLRGAHARLISLDLGAPARRRGRPPLADRPPRRRPARARGGGGARRARASTLGHFPQSFEYATIGGFAATRSAGQASSGYGRFDALVSSVRLLAPGGRDRARWRPRTPPPGPALRELVIGSEGVLGVIPDVTVRVRPAPTVRRYEAWIAESFEAGAEIVRALAQGPGLPDVDPRLRRGGDRGLAGALGAARRSPARLFDGYLGAAPAARRLPDRSSASRATRSRSPAGGRSPSARCARGGAAYLGQAAGRAWEHGRYQGPYLRDTLMGMGAMVETLETSHTWTRLGELHAAVGDAIRGALDGQGTPGLVFCHLSHAYADGASLYFTFIARARHGRRARAVGARSSAPPARRSSPPAARSPTTTRSAATTPPTWRPRSGATGLEALRAVKERLDPAGIMNPGKLIP